MFKEIYSGDLNWTYGWMHRQAFGT